MNFYQRKLYALLQAPELSNWGQDVLSKLECLNKNLDELKAWWAKEGVAATGKQAQDIGSSSDRDNLLHIEKTENTELLTVCHPISGQKQKITPLKLQDAPDISQIQNEPNAKKVFWWFWRFYPELLAAKQPDALLFPAHTIIPDCPLHSHQSTVSALAGAMFPKCWDGQAHQTPYLLIFSFSPVQEFIKSSRKFLDFWAGSYLLHYLSVQLCWHIAQQLGPDAVIIPSLWSQEIIDALIVKKYDEPYFACLQDGKDPANRFMDKTSTSLSTAGFPNKITVLVPGKEAAQKWGRYLTKKLTKEWRKIGVKVRSRIRERVIEVVKQESTQELEKILKEVFPNLHRDSRFNNVPIKFWSFLLDIDCLAGILFLRQFPTPDLDTYQKELKHLKCECCWEWNKLWDAQLNHTWEPYWTAVPLGNPEIPLSINKGTSGWFDGNWINAQRENAQQFVELPTELDAQQFVNLPTELEAKFYTEINVGTWWGSVQQRLGYCLDAVKYTRNWQIATAPGERSTISGQFSAVHPRFNYTKFHSGGGVPAGSQRLFWFLMSKAYPGLFNGSEKLNALELTKRMAWVYGGVAESLGIKIEAQADVGEESEQLQATTNKSVIAAKTIDYEQFIRFPNLCSIATARFACDRPELVQAYWQKLYELFQKHEDKFSDKMLRAFYATTRRISHVPKTDTAIQKKFPSPTDGYNGVMFSSKWLIDDMSLQEPTVARANADSSSNQNDKKPSDILREIVHQAHRDTGFGDRSPADWWAIVLADGDGMGEYVTGKKLKKYEYYLEKDAVDQSIPSFDEQLFEKLLKNIDKRMGPATHVGLNRALLDFSNRLVPYLTEKRFCGRVIYSGGDDVMVVLPIEDLPEYLLSLRAAWGGNQDPSYEFDNEQSINQNPYENTTTGYWYPKAQHPLPNRPHFTMGSGATMSMGVVIAHKSVPLPTVLENIWEAEGERAKKMPGKDGICFRVIYGGGNQLEALMKGELLSKWWNWVKEYEDYQENLSPLLYRLAEELPRRALLTNNDYLFCKAAEVIMKSRETTKQLKVFPLILEWLKDWEDWATRELQAKWSNQWEIKVREALHNSKEEQPPIGTKPEDLGKLLRFTAFWVDKRVERWQWKSK